MRGMTAAVPGCMDTSSQRVAAAFDRMQEWLGADRAPADARRSFRSGRLGFGFGDARNQI